AREAGMRRHLERQRTRRRKRALHSSRFSLGYAGRGSLELRARRTRTMAKRTLGVIGGSGLYELPGLDGVERTPDPTAFGDPSDEILGGSLAGTRLLFLPRHGHGHRLLPSELPFRANVWALKSLGADCLLAVSAVGSLREEIAPGHVVVPDQFIDRTRG